MIKFYAGGLLFGFGLALAYADGDRVPKITSVSPFAVQRGQESAIILKGENLNGAMGLHVTIGKGTASTLVPNDDPSADGKTLRAKLTLAPDAPLGDCEIRVIGPGGVSNPLPLHVGFLPVIEEKDPNGKAEQAQAIRLPAAVVGAIHESGRTDFFRFAARKGEDLVFNVHASRMGSKLDPLIVLSDAVGKEILRNDDAIGPDSFVEWRVPEDGEFVLSIRDSTWQGGENFRYRLEAGVLPHLRSIFPLGARRGVRADLSAAGLNLEGAEKIPLDLGQAPLGMREVRAETNLGPSNARLFEVSDLSDVTEQEPNNAADKANPVSLPIVINGRIGAPGDVDVFAFTAADSAELVGDVAANRLGSPLDAVLTLVDSAGSVMAQGNTFADAEARIQHKGLIQGKEYRVSVRDLLGRGSGSFGYRLYLGPPRLPPPDFAARFQPDRLVVTRGGRARFWYEVLRKGDFKGDVTLSFPDLPPGVAFEPIPATNGMATLSAAPDAPLGSFPVTLSATGKIGNEAAVRPAAPEFETRPVRQAFVTVLEAAPFALDVACGASEEETKKKLQEIGALEKTFDTQTSEFDAAQALWEKRQAGAARWTVLVPQKYTSHAEELTLQPDGSFLTKVTRSRDITHVVVARTDLKGITAFRLEVMPDKDLPGYGPGMAPDGNFVLSEFSVQVAPDLRAETGAPVKLRKATASFSREGAPVADAIDGKTGTGWEIFPQTGRAQWAVFETAEPVGSGDGTILILTLDHQSERAKHVIGRFRLSATTAKDPLQGIGLPHAVASILDVPSEKRTPEQKKDLFAYYRSSAPEPAETRRRLARLRAETCPFPPKVSREEPVSLGVKVTRAPGFTGDIFLSLDGFALKIDETTRQPLALSTEVEAFPIVLKEGEETAVLFLKARPLTAAGARNVVVKGEAVTGGRTVTQVSRAFPLTVLRSKIHVPEKPKEFTAGVEYRYFEGINDHAPDLASMEAVRSGTAENFDLSLKAREEGFGFIFTTWLEIPRDGTYTFTSRSDDGSTVHIGDALVVNNYEAPRWPIEKNGKIALAAGKHYVTVTYYQRTGSSQLEVSWEGPDFPRQRIPSSALYRAK